MCCMLSLICGSLVSKDINVKRRPSVGMRRVGGESRRTPLLATVGRVSSETLICIYGNITQCYANKTERKTKRNKTKPSNSQCFQIRSSQHIGFLDARPPGLLCNYYLPPLLPWITGTYTLKQHRRRKLGC